MVFSQDIWHFPDRPRGKRLLYLLSGYVTDTESEERNVMKDNILLITTDQQRLDTINAWGNQSIFTPHLNYMAAMGVSYKNCYASCPICVPSRTTIMTGRQGYESGVTSNATHAGFMAECMKERSTLPAILTDAGYQTCAKGKMHFEPARAQIGRASCRERV